MRSNYRTNNNTVNIQKQNPDFSNIGIFGLILHNNIAQIERNYEYILKNWYKS